MRLVNLTRIPSQHSNNTPFEPRPLWVNPEKVSTVEPEGTGARIGCDSGSFVVKESAELVADLLCEGE